MRAVGQIVFGVVIILGIPAIVFLIFTLAGFVTQPGGYVRAAEPDVGTEHEDGAVRRREQCGYPGHVLGVGLSRREQGSTWEIHGCLAVDGLQGEVDEDRASVRGRR